MIEQGSRIAVPFVKGHGTGNDFVMLPDLQDRLDLTPVDVRAICDRRRGIGGDGILRVVPTALVPQAAHLAHEAEFFMDYRNADGSLAEMCGNGARVFARYLRDAGLVDADRFRIATRAGVHEVTVSALGTGEHRSGDLPSSVDGARLVNEDVLVTIDMGPATTPHLRAAPHVQVGERTWPAVGVLMPNPHAVVFVTDLDEAGDLLQQPDVVPESIFPDGVNVEFVRVLGDDHISMRVYERGVGETQACGTGACAAAWASGRRETGEVPPGTIRVDMPGGTVQVTQTSSTLLLTGPAVFVAEGTVLLPVGSGLRSGGE